MSATSGENGNGTGVYIVHNSVVSSFMGLYIFPEFDLTLILEINGFYRNNSVGSKCALNYV